MLVGVRMNKGEFGKLVWFIIAIIIMLIVILVVSIFIIKRGQSDVFTAFGEGFLEPIVDLLRL